MKKTIDVVFTADGKFFELQVQGKPIDVGEWDMSQIDRSILHLPLEPLAELGVARDVIASKDSEITSQEKMLRSQEDIIAKLRIELKTAKLDAECAALTPTTPPQVTPQYLLFELAKLITKV